MNERKMNLRKIAMVGGMIAMTAMLSAIMMTGCGCQQRTEKNRQRGLDGKETDQSCGMVLIYLIIQMKMLGDKDLLDILSRWRYTENKFSEKYFSIL